MALKRREFGHEDVQRVVAAHYDDVHAYCRRHTQTADEAQDATQEVFLRFVRSAERYRDAGKPLAYLLTIARNVCVDAARTHARACSELPDEETLPAPDLPPGESDARSALAHALSLLPSDQQEVLELRYDQELKLSEIACVLGISRFAAKRRVDAALAALRERLESEEGGCHERCIR